MKALLFAMLASTVLQAQEASSGFDVHTTISGEGAYSHELSADPRADGPINFGLRDMLYAMWKIDDHWSVSATLQGYTRPYFYEQFSTQGYGANVDVLQASVNYSRVGPHGSLMIRVGQLSTAFGTFLLRYDDAVNPLVDMPLGYGYYYKPVTTLGMAGGELDATVGKVDFRGQYLNSSPANPRGITQSDQYGTAVLGAGYAIKQGFHVGASMYRGPYLDRSWPYFYPGESAPKRLPATAAGIDVSWAKGPWNVYSEWQHFQFDYHVITPFIEQTAYVEARRVLAPRWFLAARAQYLYSGETATRVYEIGVGYRPNRYQIAKCSYEIQQGPNVQGTLGNVFALQLVTSMPVLSAARN